MLLPRAGATVAAVADTVVGMAEAVVGTSAVDTSAVDTQWPRASRLHTLHPDMLWSDLALVRTSRLDNTLTSRVDTVAISGMAVGGITALARAGGGRTFTASTFGCAIKAACAAPAHWLHLPTSDL
jgi:hypothetical protein